jgi:hypothetical protein
MFPGGYAGHACTSSIDSVTNVDGESTDWDWVFDRVISFIVNRTINGKIPSNVKAMMICVN